MNNCNISCGNTGAVRYGTTNAPYCRANEEKFDTSCACPKSRFPANTSLAMAYVPFQQSGEIYPCERALSRGTVFPCLDLPFLKGCCK